MRNWVKSTFAGLLLYSASSQAYHPDQHKPPTQDAIELIRYCHLQMEDAFSEGVSDQDADTLVTENQEVDTSHLFDRATHWHFYDHGLMMNQQPYLEDKWFLVSYQRSLHGIFTRYQQDLESAEGTDKWQALARLMHFVQDVSVPAHVAPIYHGPFVPDAFDNYKLEVKYRPQVRDCQRLLESPGTPNEILRDAAEATRNVITSHTLNVDWQAYWPLYQPGQFNNDGFAEYGPCAPYFINDLDMQSEIPKQCAQHQFQLDQLYRQQYQQAVFQSARLLMNMQPLFRAKIFKPTEAEYHP